MTATQEAATNPTYDDAQLLRATQTAYDMVFKSVVDVSCLKAAHELGLFEILASKPHDLAALAAATESVADRLEKFLITLRQIGLLEQHDSQWALTPFAARFFASPNQHRSLTMEPFVSYLSNLLDTYYIRLADVVRGNVNFTSLIPHPPTTRDESLFYETIHRSNIYFVVKLLQEYAQLQEARHLLDVGGGIGDISAALCDHYPDLSVTLVNLPSAQELVRENVAARGFHDRITPIVLDMYKDPYPSCDALLFARILYPMNEQFSTMLCQKAYDALAPGGRILILDMIISDPDQPNYDYLTHYLCAIGMGFSVLDFKDHGLYLSILEGIGFHDIQVNEAYDHVLYQARKP